MRAPGAVIRRAVVILVLGACARQAVRPAAPARRTPAGSAADSAAADSAAADSVAEGATLEVENNSTLDVRVFVLRAGMQSRLGTVTGMTTARFALPPNVIDRELRLYANPVAGWTRLVTETLVIRPGQLVSWKLDERLRSYRLGIY